MDLNEWRKFTKDIKNAKPIPIEDLTKANTLYFYYITKFIKEPCLDIKDHSGLLSIYYIMTTHNAFIKIFFIKIPINYFLIKYFFRKNIFFRAKNAPKDAPKDAPTETGSGIETIREIARLRKKPRFGLYMNFPESIPILRNYDTKYFVQILDNKREWWYNFEQDSDIINNMLGRFYVFFVPEDIRIHETLLLDEIDRNKVNF